jgi:glycosyltransferase involved in cell wall biosynthesis
MGRLPFLQQTLPTLVAQPECRCVVVDYSCPQMTGDWVEAHFPQVEIVRVQNQTEFNLARGRNAGLAHVQEPWICFIDCDLKLSSEFAASVLPTLNAGHFYRADPLVDMGMCGSCICPTEVVQNLGGYDDVYEGWSEEDVDFYDSLEFLGLRRASFPASLLRHIPHDDDLRVQQFKKKNRWHYFTVNRIFRFIKFDLMRLNRKFLERPHREKLYQIVDQMVMDSLSQKKASELSLDLGLPDVLPKGLTLDRALRYKFRLTGG